MINAIGVAMLVFGGLALCVAIDSMWSDSVWESIKVVGAAFIGLGWFLFAVYLALAPI